MSMRQMSAKDTAFDRERQKLRHQIKELEREVQLQANEEFKLREQIYELRENDRVKDDWIRRLLEYMDISPEEFKAKIQVERTRDKMVEILSMGRVFR